MNKQSLKIVDEYQEVNLICPVCKNKGFFYILNNRVIIDSKEVCEELANLEFSNDTFDPDHYKGIAIGSLICCNQACQERVVFHGDAYTIPHGEWDEEEDEGFLTYKTGLTFTYFYPSPLLIDIPIGFPKKYMVYLSNIFNSYWQNDGSCLNNTRILLEKILDNLKVKKYNIDKINKKTIISLHHRITDHWKADAVLIKMSTALKWLGNDGSHGEKIKPEIKDLSLELLEYIIDKIYGNKKEKMLLNKAEKIIKKR